MTSKVTPTRGGGALASPIRIRVTNAVRRMSHRKGSLEAVAAAGAAAGSGSGSLWTKKLKRRILVRGQMIAAFKEAAKPKYTFWGFPKQTKRWTDAKDPDQHTNWGDLFFDLIYVGAAFSLGKMLKADMTWSGLGACSAMFLALMQAWYNKVSYCARLDNVDLLHKLVDYVESVLVAAAAVRIPETPSGLLAGNNARWFSICMLCLRFLTLCLWAEVGCASARPRGTPEMLSTARWQVTAATLGALCFAYALVFAPNDPVPSCVAWVLSVLLERGCMQLLVLRKVRPLGEVQAYMPYHGNYYLHRFGEWTMLMLGESVLSLLVVRYDARAAGVTELEYSVAFVCAFTTALSLQFIHYTTQPVHPDHHALAHGPVRAMWWANFMFLYSLALLVVGVGAKSVMFYMLDAKYGGGFAKRSGVRFMSLAAASCLVMAKAMEGLHTGASGAKASYGVQPRWFVMRSLLFVAEIILLAVLPMFGLRASVNIGVCATCVTLQAVVCCFNLEELKAHARNVAQINMIKSPQLKEMKRRVLAGAASAGAMVGRRASMPIAWATKGVILKKKAKNARNRVLEGQNDPDVPPWLKDTTSQASAARAGRQAEVATVARSRGLEPPGPFNEDQVTPLPHCSTAPGRLRPLNAPERAIVSAGTEESLTVPDEVAVEVEDADAGAGASASASASNGPKEATVVTEL
jgi:low temperature requirement protein LtrA